MMFKILENTWDKLSKKKQYGLLLALLIGVNIYYAPEKIRRTEVLEFSAEKGDMIVGIAGSRQSTSVGRGKTESYFFLPAMDFRINQKKWHCVCHLNPCAMRLNMSNEPKKGVTRDFSNHPGLERINIISVNRDKCFVISMVKDGKTYSIDEAELNQFKLGAYFIDSRVRLWRLTFTTMIIFAIFVHAFHHIKAIWLRKKL